MNSLNQIEEIIREKSPNEEDAETLLELIHKAFVSKSNLQRAIEEIKESVLND